MPEQDDLHVGRRALEEKRIRPEQLLECLQELAEERRSREGQMAARPLGVLLVRRGHVSERDLNRYLSELSGARPGQGSDDLELGRLVVAASYATKEEVEDCVRLQREGAAGSRRLGEILVERGILTTLQLQRLLSYHDKSIYACAACGVRFNLVGAKAGAAYKCRKCGGRLEAAGPEAAAVASTEHELRALPGTAPPTPPSTPSPPRERQEEVDRALALFLRQKNMIRKEDLRGAEQFQQEAARYGVEAPLLEVLRRRKLVTWKQEEQLRAVDFGKIVAGDAWRKQAVPGYNVRRKIATGGFGAIFEAEPVFGGAPVALKLLHAVRGRDPASLERFRHEARLMMKFNHPNIVKGYDLGEHRGVHYMTMELVDGRSLDQEVPPGRGLPAEEARGLATQAAKALEHMQQEGYLHRDVKPENLLLDRQRRVKLCDLGFAVEIRGLAQGQTGVTQGTVGYISPEQARGERSLKVGTDIYSLGLTLYFMLRGEHPFGAADSETMMAERFGGGVATPDFRRLSAPAPLLEVLGRMLEPDRSRRYPTYGELLAALERARG